MASFARAPALAPLRGCAGYAAFTSTTSSSPASRQLARSFAQCSRCLRGSTTTAPAPAPGLTSRLARDPSFRSMSSTSSTSSSPLPPKRLPRITTSATALRASLARRFQRASSSNASGAGTSSSSSSSKSWPDVSDKKVGYWLLGSAASVFGIVVFGGLTRLTESGLSITEWRPVTGSIPPLGAADWEAEFAKYRDSPEYHVLNPGMSLAEFKRIYYMEWIHRLWGRVLGLAVLLPAGYFVARRRVSRPMAVRLGGVCALLGLQGVIGWWMVASGLKDDLFAPGAHPRVSQYRLTTHLAAAFVLFSAMLTSGLGVLRAHRLLAAPEAGLALLRRLRDPRLAPLRRAVAALAALTFATSMTGGLVAGLDAGLIYNDFPYMGEGLAPPAAELLDDHYARKHDKSDLLWRNACENPSLVQLNHRVAALTTFSAAVALFAYTRTRRIRALAPAAVLRGAHGVLGFAVMQASLGIATLMMLVPISLASMHQAGSLLLLTWTFVLGNRVWVPARTARLLAQAAKGRPVRLAGVPSPVPRPVNAVKGKTGVAQ